MSDLVVRAAPAGATVQDAGRLGWLSSGVPPSGPLDPTAHAAANLAVGNDPRAASLEIPLGSLRVAALGALTVSVDGEDPVELADGDELVVAAAERAVRYLAVAGGLDVPEVLGSRATLLAATLGGFEGRPVRAGDTLPVGGRGTGGRSLGARPSVSDHRIPRWSWSPRGPIVGDFPSEAGTSCLGVAWRNLTAQRPRGRAARGREDLASRVTIVRRLRRCCAERSRS